MSDPSSETVFWLRGNRGAGKSTVARSVASIARKLGIPVATYSFSRTTDDRRNYRSAIPTLAYQLAMEERYRESILSTVQSASESDPLHSKPVDIQAMKLLSEVLNSSHCADPPGCLILVLDGLEYAKEAVEITHGGSLIAAIIDAITGGMGMNVAVPYVKVFLTSNREFDIESLAPWTRHRTYTTPPTVVAHDIDTDPNHGAAIGEDIERYLQAQFAKPQQTCFLPPGFPSSADTAALARLTNGSFVYARTAWEYICGPDDSETPVRRLASLIKAAPSPTLHEGTHVHLDELCSQILVTALRGSPHDYTAVGSDTREILTALVLLQKAVSCTTLAKLVDVSESRCAAFLRRIAPLLLSKLDGESAATGLGLEVVCLRHHAFVEFLSDHHRWSHPSLSQSASAMNIARDHLRMTEHCFRLLNEYLKYDICAIRDPSRFNAEMADLKARLHEHVPHWLRYACRFWAVHLIEHIRAAGAQLQIPLGLVRFCSEHLLHWIEVMSLIQELHEAQQVMIELRSILKVCSPSVFCPFTR
jgi:hypothetical protein